MNVEGMRTILFFVLLALFLIGGYPAMLTGVRTRRLLRKVGEIDPAKERELARVNNPILRLFLPFNPRQLTRFLKSGDSLGNEELKHHIDALRKIPWLAIISWVLMMLIITILGMVAYLVKS